MNAQVRFRQPMMATMLLLAAVTSWSAWAAGNPTDAAILRELAAWFLDAGNWHGARGLPVRIGEHFYYVAVAMGWAILMALPVGIGLGHWGRGGLIAINVSNIGRAVPEFGVIILVFLIAGYGDLPIIITLIALALPPMVTNSYVGMRNVDPDVRQAAQAMGMSGWQVLWKVELPIALPLVMAGLRTSAVQVMATATLAAYVGLGGLGRYLIDGLATRDMVQVLAGAVVVALLAIAIEVILALTQRTIVSRGLKV